MRRFLTLVTVHRRVGSPASAMVLAMTGLLAACGGSSTPAATSPASSTSAPASSSTSTPGASEAACNLMTLSEAETITADTAGSLVLMSATEVADLGGEPGVCWYLDPAAANTSAWAFEGLAPSGTSAAAVAAAVIEDTGWSTAPSGEDDPFANSCTASWQPVSGIGQVAYACTSTKYGGYALAFVKNNTLVAGGVFSVEGNGTAAEVGAKQYAELKHWAQGAASSL